MNISRCEQIADVAHLSARRSHGCAAVCLLYSVIRYSSTVQSVLICICVCVSMFHIVYLCRRYTRLTLLDLQTNLTDEHSPRIKLVCKEGTYYTL